MKKITQKQIAFYKLWEERRKDKDRYVPTWEFGGEMDIKGKWVLMSYKCPARLSDIMNENEGLLERKLMRGRSGSNYFTYRISQSATKENIKDISLIEFYNTIK